ncbi:alpha/beta hydrolase [Naasia lichenicola]|uniref:Alpha/beta hydrolase n=1 Tax=Naasia lichenicola TaxID=2565933 RepID=A0A4V3WTD1_9MICO|nr:alpha/beta hydrolase [Naasia lichenicola]THG31567.1 alpha/beta hydrolase [Naasia lichenicola]
MTDDLLESWPHLHLPGPDGVTESAPVLLMLHGTGSDEREISRLAPLLSAESTVLAPRGRLSENGARRWFRRFAEGVFDVDSVVTEAAALASFLDAARSEYDLDGRTIVAVGLSNGANIALATAMLHPQSLDRVIAFSGMHPLAGLEATSSLSGSEFLLLNGSDDPMAPSDSVDALETALRSAGATVDRIVRPGGHGIAQSELEAAKGWLESMSV